MPVYLLGRGSVGFGRNSLAALPAVIRNLWQLGRHLSSTDAATVSWARRGLRHDRVSGTTGSQARRGLNVPKTHCYDDALQGQDFSGGVSLPNKVLVLHSDNGRSKQQANVDQHGTNIGRTFRQQQQPPKRRRLRNPAAGRSDRRQRHGLQLIGTGETVRLSHHGTVHTGRAVIKSAGSAEE